MGMIYRNRLMINQRGGTISVDNTTEQEKVKLSQRSGSNLNLTNVVTSELATNNKQVTVVHDSFETTGGDKTEFYSKNHTLRTGENTYTLKGFINQSQLDSFSTWKDTFKPIALANSEFKISRGGVGYPNGNTTSTSGSRASNPVLGNNIFVVENKFSGYTGTDVRKSSQDDTTKYTHVPDKGKTSPASKKQINVEDVEKSAGGGGSKAPGVLEFGAGSSAATEGGNWSTNSNGTTIGDKIKEIQDILTPIEQNMGHGGDETYFTKRNKIEQVGALFNDYPSVRIDPKGRSQPLEMLVSDTGTYKNHDYAPHVEEIDNGSTFPGGNDDKIVGNRYSRNVGSGGIQLKTTGATELGGATLKGGYKKINLNASHGIQIASEAYVELQSLKSIILRTNRQVYVESALGVKGNAIIGGGLSVEGETYLQHVTAPLEVQQTEDTILFGKFAADQDRTLVIGEANVGGTFYPVYAKASNDLIVNYPHSHHFNNIPLRLMKANKDVRKKAQSEKMNSHDNVSQALAQNHERKTAQEG